MWDFTFLGKPRYLVKSAVSCHMNNTRAPRNIKAHMILAGMVLAWIIRGTPCMDVLDANDCNLLLTGIALPTASK